MSISTFYIVLVETLSRIFLTGFVWFLEDSVIAVLHVTIVKKLKACLYLNKLTFSRSQNLIPDEPSLSGQPLLSGQLPIPRGWPLNRGSTVVFKKSLIKRKISKSQNLTKQTVGNWDAMATNYTLHNFFKIKFCSSINFSRSGKIL